MKIQYDLLIRQPHEETTGPPNRVFRATTRPIPGREVIPPHYHADLEIVLFDGVQGETLVEGTAHRVRAHAVHTIAPHAVHSFSLRGIAPRSRVWVVQINLEYFRECIGRFDPHAALAVCQRVAGRPVAGARAADDLRTLILQLPEFSGGRETEIAGTLGILYSLLQKLSCDAPAGPVAARHPMIRSLMDAVASHADRPASLDQIARRCGLSKFHLCRVFRRQTGMTVNEYLTRMRILRAQHLLTAGGRTVTRACFECGFESVSYFIAVFSKIAGTTPKQWALRAMR